MTPGAKKLALVLGAAAPLGVTAVAPPTPLLLWNTTASAPVGFYRVQQVDALHDGDLAVARPPRGLSNWFDRAGYLPRGVPLVKRVAAVARQRVCRRGAAVTVDGRPVASARTHDGMGRHLPRWSGCRTLTRGEVFLLNRDVPDSLDGRYFGPSSLQDVVGRAIPLWTWKGR